MHTRLSPYLGFRDAARAALEFYHSVFGGNLTLNTYGDSKASDDPAEQEKIMHGMLETENGLVLMASDAPNTMELDDGASISLSLSGDDEAELRGYWDKLSAGATITMPLSKSPWEDLFGMLTDKFGTKWMVNITAQKE